MDKCKKCGSRLSFEQAAFGINFLCCSSCDICHPTTRKKVDHARDAFVDSNGDPTAAGLAALAELDADNDRDDNESNIGW